MYVGFMPSLRPGSIGRVSLCLMLLSLALLVPSRTQAADTVLHTFNSYGDGANPESVLIQGQDGAYYGTTYAGGTNRDGTVFKIDSTGALTTLHSFTGADGENPYAGLFQGSDGSLYGVTEHGGANGDGAVFKISPDGSVFAVLHSFAYSDGATPYGTLIQGSDGKLYGSANAGGANGDGTVFQISTDGTVFNTVHSFTYSDGANPFGGVIQASDGKLYGTTSTGGSGGYGTVFQVSTNGVTFNTIHAFSDTDGAYPYANLVQASDGKLYGTTSEGGDNGYGTVFQISTSGATFNTLHSFDSTDGAYSYSSLIQANDGNLYGTTSEGGTNGFGTVFQISTNGATFNTIHSFDTSLEGSTPDAGVVQGSDGLLHGTTVDSPAYQPVSDGTLYALSLTGSGFTTVQDFSNGFFDGQNPAYGNLVIGTDGRFYGVTQHGGAFGYGALYKMTSAGVVTILHSFTSTDGSGPLGSIVFDSQGNIYGATYFGGAHGDGVLYEYTPSSNTLTILHSFAGADGNHPAAGLVLSGGFLYGTTYSGGAGNYGSIFRYNLSTAAFKTLHSFNSTDGANVYAPLVLAADGNLYGVTQAGGSHNYGTVFKVTTDGATFSPLHAFNNTDGAYPYGGLIQASDGNLYGTTTVGGSGNYGTVFQISTDGTVFNTLHAFSNTDGGYPYAGVIQASDGNLYGTAYQGGANSNGIVFELSTNGSVFNFYSFGLSGSDGNKPYGGLVQASNGKLYGTTSAGGIWPDDGFSSPDSGVSIQGAVFSVTPPLSNGPIITSLSPSSTPADGPSFTLTVNGSGYLAGAVVNWTSGGTTTPLTTTFVSATQLTATVPASLITSMGTASITVTEGAQTSNAATFTITNPVPVLTSISPTSATAGGASFTLTANGNYFLNSSVINWNGTALTTTYVSATQLTATVPAADIANPGTASITVSTPAPGGGTSSAQTFTITNPVPVLTSISPTSATAGGASFTLTANGSKFESNSTINWNGTALTTTYVSATQLTATVPAADISLPGTASVTVVTPAPGGGTSAAQTFTINYAVTIKSLTPSTKPAGGAKFNMVVTGTGYAAGAVVQWTAGGTTTNLTTTFNSATKLTAAVPTALIASPGTATVTVMVGVQPSNPATFTITTPVPVLTSLTPSSANAGGPAFTLIVKGKGFLNSSVINWNGTALTTTYVSATQLTAPITAAMIASPGTASITVSTPGSGTSNTLTFTILVTTVKLTAAKLTVDSVTGAYTAVITLKNSGYMTASAVTVTSSTLGGAATTTTLPVNAGNIAAGATAKVTLTYPSSAGAAGAKVSLVVSGTFTGGTFTGTLKVLLP